MMKQRTTKNMTHKAGSRARRLWETMQDTFEDSPEFHRARDEYHNMFKDDRNFVDGVESYQVSS